MRGWCCLGRGSGLPLAHQHLHYMSYIAPKARQHARGRQHTAAARLPIATEHQLTPLLHIARVAPQEWHSCFLPGVESGPCDAPHSLPPCATPTADCTSAEELCQQQLQYNASCRACMLCKHTRHTVHDGLDRVKASAAANDILIACEHVQKGRLPAARGPAQGASVRVCR